MTNLTDAQRTILNCYGSEGIRDSVNKGELPDCPEVNARIAKRCLWENAHSWSYGEWFYADYLNAPYRNGRVSVQKVVYPDGEVRFTVVAQNGRWSDSHTEEEAKKYLRSHRKNGRLVYLTKEEVKKAENDHNWALSR